MMILPVNQLLDKKRYRRFGKIYDGYIHLGYDFDIEYG
jgi:hypothetical protein